MDIQRDIFFYFYPVSWIGIFQDSRKIKNDPEGSRMFQKACSDYQIVRNSQ
jgi:hypothetical protein